MERHNYVNTVEAEKDQWISAVVQTSRKKQFPFENLVLAGGGPKGLAYCGVFKALEECDIMPDIKRFAGTSVGSIAALLFAIGCTSRDVEKIFSFDLEYLVKDASKSNVARNLISGFGVCPGDRSYEFLGDILEAKGYDKDTTFEELYHKTKNELCVIVTNVNTNREEYFHVKRTPKIPVRLAVRMSIGVPALLQASKFKMLNETEYYSNGYFKYNYPRHLSEAVKLNKRCFETDYYVDGSIKCNYPIHCFDGCLSIADGKDSYRKGKGVDDFTTLGCIVYSGIDRVCNEEVLAKAYEVAHEKLPNTKLANSHKHEMLDKLELKRDELGTVINQLCKALKEYTDDGKIISMDNFKKFFEKECEQKLTDENFKLLFGRIDKDGNCKKIVKKKYVRIMFGTRVDKDKVLSAFGKDDKGNIIYDKASQFLREATIPLDEKYFGIIRLQISCGLDYIKQMAFGLITDTSAHFIAEADAKRTIGINTRYITIHDLSMEKEDKEFLFNQGYLSTLTYLENFIHKYLKKEEANKQPRKEAPKKGKKYQMRFSKLQRKYARVDNTSYWKNLTHRYPKTVKDVRPPNEEAEKKKSVLLTTCNKLFKKYMRIENTSLYIYWKDLTRIRYPLIVQGTKQQNDKDAKEEVSNKRDIYFAKKNIYKI